MTRTLTENFYKLQKSVMTTLNCLWEIILNAGKEFNLNIIQSL